MNEKNQPKIHVITKLVSEYETMAVKWLWPNRIPLGMFTLLAGKPGTGKSTLAHNIATRLSNGSAWPDSPGERMEVGSTLLITEEDSVEHIIHPRLRMMKANLNKVRMWSHIEVDGKRVRFNLVDHLDILNVFLKQHPEIKLVVFDTLESFMGDTDTHRNSKVRQVLDPLIGLSYASGVAMVGITHLNKASRENKSAMDRIMGSVGYAGAARMVWLLGKDEDEDGVVKMVMVKSNICGNPGGIAYKLQQVFTTDKSGNEVQTTIIGFRDGIVRDDADVVSQADCRAKDGRDHTGEWLQEILKNGAMLQSVVLRMAKKEGYTQSTVYRRKKSLGIVSFETKPLGKPLKWWKLAD